ncbi:hypothetical protein Daus18300_002944 [Diaporthe australafricana]|uniref:CMP/dCMP-type deaminase domain-containing protein n=1 Tax=Diaporthe australafricana TaxID=127596 RepID=A0ABR3XKS7_9PEZI
MKTDQYLNLCLEQAALSSLHYRHGCVVVKGGKVIGQGFNDCRPGYDGGSVLKTGVLPKSAVNDKPDKPDPPKPKSDFKNVESIIGNCGGGHHANARLTMHSEMMAINSALSSRSTLAANTVSHVKPHFKLLGDSKHKRALQRKAVLSYTQAVCLATFGPQVQQGAGPAQADGSRNHGYEAKYEKYKYNKYKYDKYKSKASKLETKSTATGSIIPNGEDSDDSHGSGGKGHSHDATVSTKSKFGLRKARNQHLLVPKSRAEGTSPDVQARMKVPKLVGADIYVARLANDGPAPGSRKKAIAQKPASDESLEEAGPDACTTASVVSASTGSLHDELINKTPKPGTPSPVLEDTKRSPAPVESRPCYRCVAYMHSVGIKRVFWTTSEGKWEGAKVRDLIDQLDGLMHSDTDTSLGQPALTGLFVTKHEVLMLRRLLGGEG